MDDSKLLKSRIADRIRQAEEGFYITNTDFLDLHQQALAREECRGHSDLRFWFYGGYEDAERRILIIAPKDYGETLEDVLGIEEFLQVIHVETGGSDRKLSHRDYLGSVLGLGIERRMIGDILVDEKGADMIVRPDISTFLEQEYRSVGRTDAKIEVRPIGELAVPERRVQVIRDTLPSLRLDNVVSTAFKLSRSDAVKGIRSGIVSVDHMECTKIDQRIDEGAVIVLRGKGKAVLQEIGGESKKGRIWVEILRYV